MIDTDDFVNDLKAQLHEAAEREPARARRARPRSRARRRRVLAVAAGLAVTAAAATTVVTQWGSSPEVDVVTPPTATATAVTPSPAVVRNGAVMASRAERDTREHPACRPAAEGPRRLVDRAPLAEITMALPALATPVGDPDALLASASSSVRGDVLRATLRELRFPDGVRALVYVTAGAPGRVVDPRACTNARMQRARQTTTGALRAATLAALATRTDAHPDAQTLNLWYGKGRGSRAGAGIPVIPGATLPTGILGSGGTHSGERAYVGLAGPHAARLRVGGITYPVRDGVFVLVRTTALGRRVIQELDRTGRVVASYGPGGRPRTP